MAIERVEVVGAVRRSGAGTRCVGLRCAWKSESQAALDVPSGFAKEVRDASGPTDLNTSKTHTTWHGAHTPGFGRP